MVERDSFIVLWDTPKGKHTDSQIIEAVDYTLAREFAIEHLTGLVYNGSRKYPNFQLSEKWKEARKLIRALENKEWMLIPLDMYTVMQA